MRDFEGMREQFGLGKPDEDEEEAATPVQNPIDPNAPPFAVRKIPFTGSPLSGGQDINWVSRDKLDQFGKPLVDTDGSPVKKNLQDWVTEMAASNPQLAVNFIEQLSRIVDHSSIGAMIRRLAEAGQGAAAQGAPAVAGALTQGVGAQPNGIMPQVPGGYSPP
jgi:hypothetical protein